MKYAAYVRVELGTITTAEMRKKPQQFANPDEPTTEELVNYFHSRQENLAESNSGSEAIMNTPIKFDKTAEDGDVPQKATKSLDLRIEDEHAGKFHA